MVISNNIPGLNSKRYLNRNNSKLSKSLEKLSSGYAINRAADNAAGLAVTEKMRSQICGIKQSVKNNADGISLIQTFEGALGETVAIIKRMKTLADQSANGTYDTEVDRCAIQNEFDQLRDEVSHLADTDFNGVVMLNGREMSDQFTFLTDDGVVQKAPETLEWEEGSYENNTSLPDLKMSIKKLPGFAAISDYDKYIFESIAMLDNSRIAADLVKGFPEYYFMGEKPANFSIRTEEFTGIISYCAPNGQVADVAEVNLPPIPHNAYSKATGIWTNGGVGSGSILRPTTYDADPTWTGSWSTEKGRREYHDWINSIPAVTVTVNDDLKTYTAPDGTIYEKDKQILPINSVPPTTASITWNDSIVKPGDKITVGQSHRSPNVTTSSLGQYVTVPDPTPEDPDHTRKEWREQRFSIGTISQSKAEEFWIKHAPSSGVWTHTFSYDTATKSWLNGDTPNNYTAELGISDSTIASSLAAARNQGITKDGTLSFTVTIRSCTTGTGNSGLYWNNYATNKDFSMGEYDPDNPKKGGINYHIADDGAVYTYKNSSYVDSAGYGYWVDADGNTVNLASKGVYLPLEPEDGSRVPDTDYLHDGMQIRVTNPLDGSTGTISARLNFWDSQTDALRVGYENLTFADSLTLQTNSRTKDLVNFTFKYNSHGIGDLDADLNCSAKGLGLNELTLADQENANKAIDRIDHALNKVTMVRASFGAVQNRLEHKIDNLNNTNENLISAESRIRDTDMAKEMMNFTKNQILSQASQSMLAQANQLPQGVLSLLQ